MTITLQNQWKAVTYLAPSLRRYMQRAHTVLAQLKAVCRGEGLLTIMFLRAPCTLATFWYKCKAPSDEKWLRGKVFFTLMCRKYLQGKLGHNVSGAGMSPNTWK